MKRSVCMLLCILALGGGILVGHGWATHRQNHPTFPPPPILYETIQRIVPDGTSSMKQNWQKGIARVGAVGHTPRVWQYHQELDVSDTPEMSSEWDPSKGPYFHPEVALMHRIFNCYREFLQAELATGGYRSGYWRLRNRKYISGTFYSVPEQSTYHLDAWQDDIGSKPPGPVHVRILYIPHVLCADERAEQVHGAVGVPPQHMQ